MKKRTRQKLADSVSSAAIWAIMTEAAVTPKPGLIDRANSGSHRDMDFFTLINSASGLLPWFRDCSLAGYDSGSEESPVHDPGTLFEALRQKGKEAEELMKKASGGANTHRGYIFCMGILSAAYGRLYRSMEKPTLQEIIEFSKAMTKNLEEDFSHINKKEGASHGETVFAKNGIKGVRGEVSLGFPSITKCALPLLNRLLKEGCSTNDTGIAVLLNLIARVEDTNMIHRGGIKAFSGIQKNLRLFLAGEPDIKAIIKKAADLDREFIFKNLSPGGSADLLGTTFFLYKILGENC
ncbi:MAG: triphosphoribosyl-dephospho-CoA synthase [Treponema sp.]|nr:triphosphoribosyl-dephospho-CoA synthase [Treponema sp.]